MQSKVIPVVYGFPSHLLTIAMRAETLRMGNDHLIEGQPVWTCLQCSMELFNFPFESHELQQLNVQASNDDIQLAAASFGMPAAEMDQS